MLSHLRFHRRGPSNPPSPLPPEHHHHHHNTPPSLEPTPTTTTTGDTTTATTSPPRDHDPASAHTHGHAHGHAYAVPRPSSSAANASTAMPPVLPPIARVASSESESTLAFFDDDFLAESRGAASAPRPRQPPNAPTPPPAASAATTTPAAATSASGFIGGVALEKYRRDMQDARNVQAAGPPTTTTTTTTTTSTERRGIAPRHRPSKPLPPINTAVASSGRPNVTVVRDARQISGAAAAPPSSSSSSSSFVAPTEIRNTASASTSLAGRRPSATRVFSDPTALQQTTTTMTMTSSSSAAAAAASAAVAAVASSSGLEPSGKSRKGLPFLKNPMTSLLLRRKAAQHAADLRPLTLQSQDADQPAYDPRIRGTRVHDFSAPRPRRVQPAAAAAAATAAVTATATTTSLPAPPPPEGADELEKKAHISQPAVEAGSNRRDSPPAPASSAAAPAAAPAVGRHPSADKPLPRQPPAQLSSPTSPSSSSAQGTTTTTTTTTTPPSLERSTTASRPASSSIIGRSAAPSSTRTAQSAQSRTVSSSGVSLRDAAVASAVPRHMKSTSSRFSFDMIGAAKQEKWLEERHRQRQLERGGRPATEDGDSRFGDLDDDDAAFDYDAMLDEDDGFEERIPGVNVDAEDDDDFYHDDDDGWGGGGGDDAAADPDNDQHNFAGFVFQRSNPASSLASPYTPGLLLPTPRDADGRVIGSALTKDTTPDLPPSVSPLFATNGLKPDAGASTAGLGIQDMDGTIHVDGPPPPPPPPKPPANPADDLYYFDEGLAEELQFEPEPSTSFDESLFDIEDTDRWGRPIPGAFARAKAQRRAEREAAAAAAAAAAATAAKRESDTTTHFSSGDLRSSVGSASTTHTSVSAAGGLQPAPLALKRQDSLQEQQQQQQIQQQQPPQLPVTGEDLAYQAALAEAAQKAAASGKFRRRSSSPPLPSIEADPLDVASTMTTTTTTDRQTTSSAPPPTASAAAAVGTEEEKARQNPPAENDGADGLFYDDEDDDGFGRGSDDFDFDDEAIIAEANASALANDLEGFYGQEFGFYSAPSLPGPSSHHYHHHYSSSASSSSSSSKALSAENLYQYANGGYFGPAGGLDRSTSGRVASREPNLTPITERSEYSNRNSIMSLSALPGASGNSNSNSINNANGLQSPGLAQLAMMAAEEGDGAGDMTLSALLRLRSRTWGGSQASLVSSSREGSPKSESMMPPPPPAAAVGGGGDASFRSGSPLGGGGGYLQHARKNSTFSLWSGGSEPGSAGGGDGLSASGSPTLTVAMPFPLSSPPLPPSSSPPTVQPPPLASPLLAAAAAAAASCPPVPEAAEEEPNQPPAWAVAASERVSPAGTTGGNSSLAGSGLWMKPAAGVATGAEGADDGGEEDGLPRRTSSPALVSPPLQPQPQQQPQHQGRRPGMGHRHRGSADSISYVKDEEGGETRWVMERRRTGESGEVEILEREFVEGGRI